MKAKEKATIKELFIKHPEWSAHQIAKAVSYSYYECLPLLKKLGYKMHNHQQARKAVKNGKKPAKPIIEKPKPVEQPKKEYQICK